MEKVAIDRQRHGKHARRGYIARTKGKKVSESEGLKSAVSGRSLQVSSASSWLAVSNRHCEQPLTSND
jgi:hypothetical protein